MSDEPLSLSSKTQIRDVWESNLESEVALISNLVDRFRYVAMDTEFPGIVCRAVGTFKSNTDYNYAGLKTNVNMLKMIQLGLTFCDSDGNLPDCDGSGRGCVWQFNFREFDIRNDIFAVDSINLLKDSGIDFERFREEGVPFARFAELLMSSGVVLNDNLKWVTFHSGHDFGYLVKLLTGSTLPDTQKEFFDLVKVFFPVLYDVKHLMKFHNGLHGGLNKLAELLEVERVGTCHQAGSDSLLTCMNFMKVKDGYFNGDVERYAGVLFGLGVESQKNNTY